jgi:hypothetical protein
MSEKIQPSHIEREAYVISDNRRCSRCAHSWKDSDASMICGNGLRRSVFSVW